MLYARLMITLVNQHLQIYSELSRNVQISIRMNSDLLNSLKCRLVV